MITRRFYKGISFENPLPAVVPPPAIPVEQLLKNFMRTGKLDAYVNPDISYDFEPDPSDPAAAAKAAADGLLDIRPENMTRFEAAQVLKEQKPNMPKVPEAPADPQTPTADPGNAPDVEQ